MIRQIEIIGEACNNLEDNFKNTHPNIPWSQIVAMRNKLAHEYWDIDIPIVWQTAKVESLQLKEQLLTLLDTLGR